MKDGARIDASIAVPFIVFTLVWSSTWIVIRDQLGVVPPQWSVAYRFAIAAVAMAAVARLVYVRREWVWPAIAVPALLVALAVTFTRNAWIGTVTGVGTLLALRRPRLLWFLPVVVVLGFAIAPQSIRSRALSTFDMNDPTVRDRFAMMEVGWRMVQDSPIFGVG